MVEFKFKIMLELCVSVSLVQTSTVNTYTVFNYRRSHTRYTYEHTDCCKQSYETLTTCCSMSLHDQWSYKNNVRTFWC